MTKPQSKHVAVETSGKVRVIRPHASQRTNVALVMVATSILASTSASRRARMRGLTTGGGVELQPVVMPSRRGRSLIVRKSMYRSLRFPYAVGNPTLSRRPYLPYLETWGAGGILAQLNPILKKETSQKLPFSQILPPRSNKLRTVTKRTCGVGMSG